MKNKLRPLIALFITYSLYPSCPALGEPAVGDADTFRVERLIHAVAASPDFCLLPGRAQFHLAALNGPLAAVPAGPDRLRALIGNHRGFLPADQVARLLDETKLPIDELLLELIPIAKDVSRPQVSNYPVGAVGLGGSGAVYFGGNLSFIGVPNSESVHAEQAVIVNAKLHGETKLATLAVSDEPCGMCRQFLHALGHAGELKILVPNKEPISLQELLPRAYGSVKSGGILTDGTSALALGAASIDSAPDVTAAAFQAAKTANTKFSPAGVALKTTDGRIYSGGYIEISGGNPSLPPLQGALVGLALDGQPYSSIQEAVLVELSESRVIQEAMTRELLRRIAPQAVFTAVQIERQK